MSSAAQNRRLVAVPDPSPAEPAHATTGNAIALARVVGRDGDRFRVRIGGDERTAECDPCVDPALVEGAIASGARVVVEDGPGPVIVGALVVARPVTVNAQEEVNVSVKRFVVAAEEEATLRTHSAFLQVKGDEVEIFARRILSRARELARILARAIQLN